MKGLKTGGRVVGSENKTTKEVKEVFKMAFDTLQGIPGVNIVDWAKDNPTEMTPG